LPGEAHRGSDDLVANRRDAIAIEHTKEFGIYHWDTFDNETYMVDEADTLEQAEAMVKEKYGSRIRSSGADQVDIVDRKGNLVRSYRVG